MVLLILVELLIEGGTMVALILLADFTTDVAESAYAVDNIDELVSRPTYSSISNYSTILTVSGIAKPPIVELDMLIDEVLSQQDIRSLANYKLLSREFLLGFPCVESSGTMVFKTELKDGSIFSDLVFAKSNETTEGYQTKVKGIYQIKGSGGGSRWLRDKFNSIYKPALVNFTTPDRPNQFYLPDVVYSLAVSFGKTEFGNVYNRYGDYINKYANICNLTGEQRAEVVQALACAVYHGQRESGSKYTYQTVRETLAAYLCYAIKDLGSFKVLSPYSGDDFSSTVRNLILGEDDKGGKLHERYAGKVKLTNGTYLEDSLIQHISDKYMNGLVMQVYLELYNNMDEYQNQFVNYGYGIGTLSCGAMRVQTVEQFRSMCNADVSQNAQFLKVKEYMQSHGLNYTKNFVKLGNISDQTGGFLVSMADVSVGYMGQTFEFPMFVFDNGKRQSEGRIVLKYDISQHLSARGFLYDLPDQLCYGGSNNGASALTCDIRVIPALNAMCKAWSLYDDANGKTGQVIQAQSAYRTYQKSMELMISWANKVALSGRATWQLSDAQFIIDNAYTEGGSLYLTQSAKELRAYAAEPGKSAHFTGRVFDFNTSNNPNIHAWLVENASSFGFYPYSAEKWHWEYNPEIGIKETN